MGARARACVCVCSDWEALAEKRALELRGAKDAKRTESIAPFAKEMARYARCNVALECWTVVQRVATWCAALHPNVPWCAVMHGMAPW